jgi:glyoxylase-like metal-dependent hydrolase (beta-lactamase superfamily II)/ferredoxin
MADRTRAVKSNVSGDMFVDDTCFNCGAARHFAPEMFGADGHHAFVKHQPETDAQKQAALRALIACPVAAIGTRSKSDLAQARASFPLELAPGVHVNGFNDEKSFGAHSYFLRGAGANWLVDAPRFARHLVRRFEEMGGIDYIFLSHRDDVADAALYAAHFNAARIIHRLELSAQPDAETVIDSLDRGDADGHAFSEAEILVTPGHTAGHMVLLWRDKYLFTGDHFAWLQAFEKFGSFRRHCWYSWDEQIKSVARMAAFKNVEWVLPGHGMWGAVEPGTFPQVIARAVADMKAAR